MLTPRKYAKAMIERRNHLKISATRQFEMNMAAQLANQYGMMQSQNLSIWQGYGNQLNAVTWPQPVRLGCRPPNVNRYRLRKYKPTNYIFDSIMGSGSDMLGLFL